jgi:hypothetical protein
MLNNMACQKPVTLNPSIKNSAVRMMQAFITNKNKPNVSNVAGSVSIIKIGFTTASKTANNRANIIAVKIVLSSMPGKMYANTKAFTVEIKMRNKNFIVENI